jgi:NUDE protein, C-terminal conserved region
MQKEIDALREAQKLIQSRLRDMEMSNDDMERNDRYLSWVSLADNRVVKSSLEDIQMKYDKATEEVALLQAELASAETLRVENQRLKDELRDLKEEYAVVKEKASRRVNEPSPSPSSQRHHTPPSPPISDGSRALTPGLESLSPPKAHGVNGVGGINGTGTWRGVRRGVGKRMSIASDVSWASEARQTSSVKVMHDMVSRVKVSSLH